MRAAHAAGRDRLYGSVDYHFAAEGHRVVAATVAPVLLTRLRSDGETRNGS